MTTLDAKIRIGAQVDQAIAALRGLKREVAGVQEQARKPSGTGGLLEDLQGGAKGVGVAMAGIRSTLVGLAGAAGVGALVKLTHELVQARIEAERLSSLLNLKNDGNVIRTGQDLQFLRRVTADLGQEFQTTAELFGKFGFAAKGTRLEGQGVREVFESVLRASTALNLGTSDLTGVLLALQQMISKGKVSAEELRGQLGERLPGAVQIAARALGVTTQELDKMLERGELLAEDFLPKFARELDKSMGTAPQQAAKGLQAEINRLSTAVSDLMKALADAGAADASKAVITTVREAVAGLAADIKQAREEGEGLFSVLRSRTSFSGLFGMGFKRASEDDLPGLVQQEAELRKRLAAMQARTDTGADANPAVSTGAVELGRRRAAEQLAALQARIASIPTTPNGSDNRFARSAAFEQAGIDASDAILARRAAALIPVPKKEGELHIARAREVYDKELELLEDKLKREQAANQRAFDAGLKDVEAYLGERGHLEHDASEAEVRELQAKLVAARKARAANVKALATEKDPEDRLRLQDAIFQQTQQIAKIEVDITKAKRDQADAARATAEVQRTSAIELQRALRDVDEQIHQALGKETTEQIAARIKAQFEPVAREIERLGGNRSKVDDLVKIKTAHEQLNQSAREFATIQEAIRLKEAEVDLQVEQGALTTEEAERAKFKIRDASLAQLRTMLEAQRALAQSDEERNAIEQRVQDIKRLQDRTSEFERTLRSAGQSGATQFFRDILSGSKSAKDAMLDFAQSVIASMQDLIARQLGEQLMQSLFGSSGGGAGGAGGGGLASFVVDAFTLLANGFHQGGIVGAPGAESFTRRMPAAAFAYAPRFHKGGIVGLKPNEVPVVAEVGEEWLTRDDPRHTLNGGGAGGPVVQLGNISITGANGSAAQMAQEARQLNEQVLGVVNTWAAEQSRSGGILARR
jgi:tape measure domain-containing protein